jgi:hypothetical protein
MDQDEDAEEEGGDDDPDDGHAFECTQHSSCKRKGRLPPPNRPWPPSCLWPWAYADCRTRPRFPGRLAALYPCPLVRTMLRIRWMAGGGWRMYHKSAERSEARRAPASGRPAVWWLVAGGWRLGAGRPSGASRIGDKCRSK